MYLRHLISMLLWALPAIAIPACSDKGSNSSEDTDSDADTDSTATSDSDPDSDPDSAADSESETFCPAGTTMACDCDSSVPGVSRCTPDGSAWTDCDCPVYGLHLFVDGNAASGDGTAESPFATLSEAQAHILSVIAATGVPDDGIAVWIRGGVYPLADTLTLTAEDSGTAEDEVAWRGYPGETVRLTGGTVLDGGDFAPVAESSPVFDRLDAEARSQIVQIDLSAQGITDFGVFERRGFCTEQENSPLELFFNGEPMTLGRWPDIDEGVGDVDPTADSIEIFGDLTPDVTGTYTRIGENDGVSVFMRDGLVDGAQYYLYRNYWEYQETWHRAWFLTTDESGYPSNNGPWWNLYASEPAPMNPSNGAVGTPLFLEPGAIRNGMSSVLEAVSDTVWRYGGDRPNRWTQAGDVWFHGWWEFPWADCRVAASEVDTGTRTVTLADDTGYGIVAGQPFYAFNLLEEITQPGEWYLDHETGILYFYPPSSLDDAEIIVSVLAVPLVRIENATHVALRDLILEAGRHSLVEINGGSDNVLDGVTLRNSGGRAARIQGTRNGIRNCVIHGTATGGVSLYGGDRASLTLAENFVENCDIHHFGRIEWTYRPGVSIGDAGQRVLNNDIHHAPHSAILYGGNEHTISLNDIHHVCEYSSDAGAIYGGRDWGARGTLITNNFVHHMNTKLDGYGVHGIYLDDCQSGITVEGNIVYEIEDHGILHGGGRDNFINNNILVNCGDAISADKRGIDWRPDAGPNNVPGDSWNLLEKLQNNNYQEEPWLSAYPSCAAIPNDWEAIIAPEALWLYPEGCTFERNLGFNNGNWMQGGDAYDYYASIADNVEDADPLFTDEAALDMTLLPDSPAYDIPGFVDIPFADIGVQNR